MTTSEAIALCESQGLLRFPDANRPQLSAHRLKELNKIGDARVGSRKKPSQVGELRRYIVYPK